MALKIIPIVWRMFRRGYFEFVPEVHRWLPGVLGVAFSLWLAIQTTFVLDGSSFDSVAALAFPTLLMLLYVTVPILKALIVLTKHMFRWHPVIGVILCLPAYSSIVGFSIVLLLLTRDYFSPESPAHAVFIIFLFFWMFYRMQLQDYRIWLQLVLTLTVYVVSLPLAFGLDYVLTFSTQYQLVAAEALLLLPEDVSVRAGNIFTLHYVVWQGFFMLVFLTFFDMVRVRNEMQNVDAMLHVVSDVNKNEIPTGTHDTGAPPQKSV